METGKFVLWKFGSDIEALQTIRNQNYSTFLFPSFAHILYVGLYLFGSDTLLKRASFVKSLWLSASFHGMERLHFTTKCCHDLSSIFNFFSTLFARTQWTQLNTHWTIYEIFVRPPAHCIAKKMLHLISRNVKHLFCSLYFGRKKKLCMNKCTIESK